MQGLVAIDSHREVEQEHQNAESEESEEERGSGHLANHLTREDYLEER